MRDGAPDLPLRRLTGSPALDRPRRSLAQARADNALSALWSRICVALGELVPAGGSRCNGAVAKAIVRGPDGRLYSLTLQALPPEPTERNAA